MHRTFVETLKFLKNYHICHTLTLVLQCTSAIWEPKMRKRNDNSVAKIMTVQKCEFIHQNIKRIGIISIKEILSFL